MGLSFDAARLTATLRDAERSFHLDASGLRLDAGEIVALSGESGCGKTLLLELLCLIRRPDPGAQFCLSTPGRETDLAAAWEGPRASDELPALRASLFGFVPQTGGLFPFLTAGENVALTQRIAGRYDTEWATALIEDLGLRDLVGLYPEQLSIGQRQRVAIARSLSHHPMAVIADEPTASLDPAAARRVLDLMISAARRAGAMVILSCHDLGLLKEANLPRLTFSVSQPDADNQVTSRLNVEPV